MRIALVVVALLLAFPATASADVIFDPADAEELAAVLEEAAAGQDVCYGWHVTVDDGALGTQDQSVGSNFGAGEPLSSAGESCGTRVEFRAFITYTAESSEAEDSATYDVVSSSSGPTTEDLNNLELGLDGLAGENPDVVVAKAVAALPLLAADAGVADPIEATPAPESEAADAQLTDSPGSDFWRGNSGLVFWGGGLLLAGGVFAWWVIRSARRYKRYYAPVEEIPAYVPVDLVEEAHRDPDFARYAEPEPDPEAAWARPPVAEPDPATKRDTAEPAGEAGSAGDAGPAAEAEPAAESGPVAGAGSAGEAGSAAEAEPVAGAEPASGSESDAAAEPDVKPESASAGTPPTAGSDAAASGEPAGSEAEPASGAEPAAEAEAESGTEPGSGTEGEPPPSTRAPESTSDKDKE